MHPLFARNSLDDGVRTALRSEKSSGARSHMISHSRLDDIHLSSPARFFHSPSPTAPRHSTQWLTVLHKSLDTSRTRTGEACSQERSRSLQVC